MKKVCVFTGSNRGNDPAHVEAAVALGHELAGRGMALVYGASRVGLMGVIANAVLEKNGDVTGVIPRSLCRKELMHEGLTKTFVVNSMHERKARFSELSDGFIALPGGLGTLEELFEVLTWAQLGFHSKPVAMLNANGYFDELLVFLDKTVAQGFVSAAHHSMILVEQDPKALLDAMQAYKPNLQSKWIDRADKL